MRTLNWWRSDTLVIPANRLVDTDPPGFSAMETEDRERMPWRPGADTEHRVGLASPLHIGGTEA